MSADSVLISSVCIQSKIQMKGRTPKPHILFGKINDLLWEYIVFGSEPAKNHEADKKGKIMVSNTFAASWAQ